MENFENKLKDILSQKNIDKSKVARVAIVEGWANRCQIAAENVFEDKIVEPVLLFETKAQYEQMIPQDGIEYIIIEEQEEMIKEFSEKFVEIRNGKEDLEKVLKLMKTAPFFAAMMLRLGKVDGAIGGVYNSTANILRAAFKAIGPAKGVNTISSVMLMHKGSKMYAFSDISVNPQPTQDQLVDIAYNASDFMRAAGYKSKVAFLSFSTDGSAVTEETSKIAKATEEYNKKHNPKYNAIGEIQFDAAIDMTTRRAKYKKPGGFKKEPTIFVFPDLASGNIGYKIAQRMGDWGAIGPVITGIEKPFNDLSRGATANDVLNTIIITAIQALSKGEK